MLLTPALTTALLFKNELDSYKTFSQQAAYLWNAEQAQEWYHSGKRTFECTKLMMSIKVYSIIKAHGKKVFGENYDHLYNLTEVFATILKNKPNFHLLIEPESNILNFRYEPESKQDLNLLNEEIQKQLVEAGNFYIVSVVLSGKRYLRCSVMNPLTTTAVFENLLEEIISIGHKLLS
jgi:L-2,4-diaminobutyrate decarboxylase